MFKKTFLPLLELGLLGVALSLVSLSAHAVPSFARQTGLACEVCHTIYPELTPFGRLFKLNGYTLTGLRQIEEGGASPLKINAIPPLSAMLQIAATNTAKAQPGTQNNDVEFPEQLSFFFAGEITPRIGSFMQVTYDHQSDHFTLDNTDIRYANHTTIGGKDTIYGLTLNNNPTVEDPWNSTPAWGFPWAASDVAPTPAAATLVDGTLAQQVAGLGGYTLWDNQWYGDVTLYRSSPTAKGQPLPIAGTIKGVAPYWRLAWQKQLGNSYLEIGTYGMQAQFNRGVSGAGTPGTTGKYTDYAFDTQYERPFGNDLLSLHATYIHENQDHATGGPAANAKDTLKTFRMDGTYHFDHRYGATLGYFNTSGTTDTGLYAPAPITGSANGSPDSSGWVAQVSYLPWENTQFMLQYTAYNKFNGASSNYDGSGRNASDNNTLFLLAWLMW